MKLISYKNIIVYICGYIEKCSKVYLLNVSNDQLRKTFAVFYYLLFLRFHHCYKNI